MAILLLKFLLKNFSDGKIRQKLSLWKSSPLDFYSALMFQDMLKASRIVFLY